MRFSPDRPWSPPDIDAMATRTLVPLLLLTGLVGASEAAAQEGSLCPPAGATVDSAGRRPDIVIRASASAEEVRFSGEPKIDVRLTGCSVLDSVRVLERRNLPRPVQPNVTYRDVHIAVEILGHLDVQCLLPTLAGAAAGADSLRGRLPTLCRGAPADSAAPAPVRQ
jgi:hypothetical protein